MVKRKADGIDALIKKAPMPIEEIHLLDWFASMALLAGIDAPKEAYDLAEEMIEERARRYK